MNKITTFTMIILIFVILLLSFIPLIFISTYVFTGCSKESFIIILQQIPVDRFWLVGLPLFVMCYVITFYLLWRFFKFGIREPELFKKKEIYHLEDSDINKKISELLLGNKSNK